MPKRIEYKGNNTYILRVVIGYNPTGTVKTKNITITANSKFEAEAKYNCWKANIENSLQLKGVIPETVNDLIDHWYENVGSIGKKDSTKASDKHTSMRIREALGHLKVSKVTYVHLNKFTKALEEAPNLNDPDKHLSTRTIRGYQNFLKKIFSYSVKIGIRIDNPCDNMTIIPKKKTKITLPSLNYMQKFLKEMDKLPINQKTALYLALFLGLRRGEICGLHWDDINFKENTITISWNRVKNDKIVKNSSQHNIIIGSSILSTPKTEESSRILAIPRTLSEMLINLYAENNKHIEIYKKHPNYQKSFAEYVIINPETGAPISVDTVSRITSRLCKKIGGLKFSTHRLRHLATSVLIDQKLSLKEVQTIIGHADAKTTLDTYTHILRPVCRDAADTMENFVKNLKEPSIS